MNRRSFLQVASTAGLAALLPTWLVKRPPSREIDLQPFCDNSDSFLHSCAATPFIQESPSGLYKFATDGRICVKVPGIELDRGDALPRRPNAMALAWDPKNSSWKTWPRENYQLGLVTCPDCDGNGWILESDERMMVKHCRTCKETGTVPGPAFQQVGEHWINCNYDAKIRKHLGGGEFAVVQGRIHAFYPVDQILFRFQGGQALLTVLYTDRVLAQMHKISKLTCHPGRRA